MDLFWIFFETGTNVIEALMFFMLLKYRIGFNKNRKILAQFGFLVIAAFTTIANIVKLNTVVFYIVSTLIELAYAVYCFDNKNNLRYFLGFALLVFSTIANTIVSFSVTLIDPEGAFATLQSSIMRIEAVSAYLLLMLILTLIAINIKVKMNEIKPKHLAFLFALLLINMIGIITILYFSIENAAKISLIPFAVVSVILFISSIAIILLFYSLAHTNQRLYEEHLIQEEQKKQIQHLSQMSVVIDELRKSKHDNDLQLRTIRTMSANAKADEIEDYISGLLGYGEQAVNFVYTGNMVVDAVVSEHAVYAKSKGIHFTPTLLVPKGLPFTDFELSSIIGNLLDNACEACLKLNDDVYKFINIHISAKGDMLHIWVLNRTNGVYKRSKGRLTTSKNGSLEHGLGLTRVTDIVNHYGGTCLLEPKEATFEANVFLPLTN